MTKLPHLTHVTHPLVQHKLTLMRDKDTPNLATLNSVGALTPPQSSPFGSGDRNRAYLNGDAVFYVRDNEVWGALWQTPDATNGPF